MCIAAVMNFAVGIADDRCMSLNSHGLVCQMLCPYDIPCSTKIKRIIHGIPEFHLDQSTDTC